MKLSQIISGVIKVLLYFILTVGAITVLIPFLWMLATAFKPYTEMFKLPISFLPKSPTFQNFVELAHTFSFPYKS